MGFLAAANQLAGELSNATLPPAQAAVTSQLIFNQRLDAALTVILCLILWIVVADTARVCWRAVNGLTVPPSSETPAQFVTPAAP